MRAPSLPQVRSVFAEVADAALEITVVGSFSRVGFESRRRLFAWTDLPAGSLAGKVALVTGASSGLGRATALGLAELGAQVVLLGRDRGRTEDARALIERQTGNGDLRVVVADLARLHDVRRAADEIINTCDRLDVVVHNAGTLTHRCERTVDGLEVTAQTHVVAPFLLTAQLLDRLATSQGRVITVTSGGMYSTGVDLDRLTAPRADTFDGVKAYANAKRAQVVLNEQWASRYGRTGITFHAMHPGWADTAGVRSSLPAFHRLMKPILRTPAQGVDTTLWLAAAADPGRGNGELWLDRHRRRTVHLPRTSVSDSDADRLWNWCASAAGTDPEIPPTPRQQSGTPTPATRS
jgi:NAD(P)-dependent dehydrogenase (short-subunit alcohol dehydrogenase family)